MICDRCDPATPGWKWVHHRGEFQDGYHVRCRWCVGGIRVLAREVGARPDVEWRRLKIEMHRLGRYLIFAGADHYPAGGWLDLKTAYDRQDEACAVCRTWYLQTIISPIDWAYVVDSRTGQIVYDAENPECSPAEMSRMKWRTPAQFMADHGMPMPKPCAPRGKPRSAG